MRMKLVLLTAAVLFLSVGIAAGGKSPAGKLRSINSGLVGFGSAPDHHPRGLAELVGTNSQGDVFVQATSGTDDGNRGLFRFRADGRSDERFTERIAPFFGRAESAVVAGDRVLISSGRRILGFGPEGNRAPGFGVGGRLNLGKFVLEMAPVSQGDFIVAASRSRFSPYQVEFSRFTVDGDLIASRTVDGSQWFDLKSVSPQGAIAYTTGGDSTDYGTWDSLYLLRDLFHKPKWISTLEYEDFGDVEIRQGGGFLMSWGSHTTVTDENGDIVPAFGDDGTLLCQRAVVEGVVTSPGLVTYDREGRIVGAGRKGPDGCGIGRVFNDGSTDSGFDFQSASAAMPRGATDIAATDSRVLVAWWDREQGGPGVTSFAGNGQVDLGFGGDGKSSTVLRSPNDDVPLNSVADSRGRVLVAGISRSADSLVTRLAVARNLPEGKPDPGFGDGGTMLVDPGGKVRSADLSRLKSGAVMVAGSIEREDGSSAGYLFKLSRGGAPDRSFGTDGVRTVDVPGYESTRFAAIKSSGNGFLVTGSVCCSATGQDALLARFRATGMPDPKFGESGFAVRDLFSLAADDGPAGDRDSGVAIDVDRRGRAVVLARSVRAGSGYETALFRATADGGERPFAKASAIWIPVFRLLRDPSGRYFRWGQRRDGRDVKVLDSGRILIATALENDGYWSPRGGSKALGTLVALRPDGRRDRRFGRHGFVFNDAQTFNRLAFDRCGRILAGGSRVIGEKFSLALSRYSRSGRLSASSGPKSRRIGGVNSVEPGASLAISGGRAFVSGPVAPAYRSADFGTVVYRVPGGCR